MRQPDRRPLLALSLVNLRLLNMPADPNDEDSRQQPDREQRAPGYLFGQECVDSGIDQRRGAPANRPAGLHQPDGTPSVFVADHLAHQHGARGPFAAEAEPVQCA